MWAEGSSLIKSNLLIASSSITLSATSICFYFWCVKNTVTPGTVWCHHCDLCQDASSFFQLFIMGGVICFHILWSYCSKYFKGLFCILRCNLYFVIVVLSQSHVRLFRHPMDCSLPGSPVHEIFRQEYRSGLPRHFFLQGIIPSQGSNLHLLHWLEDSLLQSHQGSPMWTVLSTIIL